MLTYRCIFYHPAHCLRDGYGKTALLVEWEDARWVAHADDSFQRPTEPESVNPFFSCALDIDFFYITTNG